MLAIGASDEKVKNIIKGNLGKGGICRWWFIYIRTR